MPASQGYYDEVLRSARSCARMAQQIQAATAQATRRPRASGESQLGHTLAKPSGQVENAIPASSTGAPSQRDPIPRNGVQAVRRWRRAARDGGRVVGVPGPVRLSRAL